MPAPSSTRPAELVWQQPGSWASRSPTTRSVSDGGYTNRPNVSGKVHYPKKFGGVVQHGPVLRSGSSLARWTEPGLRQRRQGRNRRPGPRELHDSLYKSFAMTERAHFELRFESFNTFNHTEFNGFNNRLRMTSQFGQVTSTSGIPACSNWVASSCSKSTLNQGAAGNSRRALFLCSRQFARLRCRERKLMETRNANRC